MSEMALKLIRKAKAERWKTLDLGNCGIVGGLPRELGELVDLEELILSGKWWDAVTGTQKSSQNNGPKNEIVALGAYLPSNLASLVAHGLGLHDISSLADLANLSSLNLGLNQVTDIRPLEALANLSSLDLGGNQVADIGPIAGLAQLTHLNIGSNKVADISPLAGLAQLVALNLWYNQVAEISPLATLVQLDSLILSINQVFDVRPLAMLARLVVLDLADNQVADIRPLAGLTQLNTLDLSGNHVADISILAALQNLSSLNLWGNQVADISALEALQNLSWLLLSHNQVADISPLREIIEKNGIKVKLGDWDGSGGIFLKDCPLGNPPLEIAAQGNAAILKYWEEKELQGTKPIYETKLLIVGEGGVGKTTLLRRLYCPEMDMPDGTESTKGIQIHRHSYEIAADKSMTLNAWDFGGQEIYHATHQFFLTKRSLYVLVDDTRVDDSKAEDAKFQYWLEMIELLGGDSPVLIFQNEKSGRHKDIDKLGIRKQFPNVHQEFYAGDLNSPSAADKLRSAIAHLAQGLPHVGEAWPKKWYAIREALEEMGKERPYISLQAYFELYKELYEENNEGALRLSAWLHDLGVLLHFQDDDLLRDLVILQNEWGTDAVFKMLDDTEVQKAGGYFTEADCTRTWDAPQYAGKQKELRQLMLKFELSYALRDAVPQQWLATQLLPQTPPEHGFGEQSDDLVLQYNYDVMPKGLVARLMVRKNQYVADSKLAWRQGVIFQYRDSAALVYMPYGKKEIHLRARGDGKQVLLALIADDLDALNRTFDGLQGKVTKMVPCLCKVCSELAVPHLYDFEKLLQRKELGKRSIECGNKPFHEVEVAALLEGVSLREGHAPIQTISIFLASTLELKEDREAFEIFINRQNKHLIKEGIFLHLEIWEDSLEAMSTTRSQDEYNKLVRESDIFVSLFFTRVGKYTEEEFDAAHSQFKQTGKPLVFTYFKEVDINIRNVDERILSLLAFKKRLGELGHFPGKYANLDDLQHQFSNQLRRMIEILAVRR